MAEWPTPRYPVTLLDELAALDPPQRREVARQLLKVAETFAVVSDGRHAAPMHWSCWSTCSIRLMGADPFLRGACGTPGMVRTFGTCEGDRGSSPATMSVSTLPLSRISGLSMR